MLFGYAVVLAGCGFDFDLNLNFNTDATWMYATSRGTGTTEVEICAGPSGLLDCNDHERFHVVMSGQSVDATAGFLSFGLQTAWLTADGAVPVSVVRTRDGATATVTMPEPLTLSGIAPSAVIVRGRDRVRVRWQPSGFSDPVRWRATATCGNTTYSREGDVPDGGELELDAASLPDVESGGCPAGLTLRRERAGAMSAAFPAGSTLTARQERSLGFLLMP